MRKRYAISGKSVEPICTVTQKLQSFMHLSSASPGGGGGGADVGTLLIVHFKVLVLPHPWGIFFLKSPQYLAKPSTQLDLKMHFRTLFWFFQSSQVNLLGKSEICNGSAVL